MLRISPISVPAYAHSSLKNLSYKGGLKDKDPRQLPFDGVPYCATILYDEDKDITTVSADLGWEKPLKKRVDGDEREYYRDTLIYEYGMDDKDVRVVSTVKGGNTSKIKPADSELKAKVIAYEIQYQQRLKDRNLLMTPIDVTKMVFYNPESPEKNLSESFASFVMDFYNDAPGSFDVFEELDKLNKINTFDLPSNTFVTENMDMVKVSPDGRRICFSTKENKQGVSYLANFSLDKGKLTIGTNSGKFVFSDNAGPKIDPKGYQERKDAIKEQYRQKHHKTTVGERISRALDKIGDAMFSL